jgi:hypothetical protein
MLVPTDGSQSALKAVQVAGEIARRFQSQEEPGGELPEL